MFSAQHINCSFLRIFDKESSYSSEYVCPQGALIVWNEDSGDLKVFTKIFSYLDEDMSKINGKTFRNISIVHQEENGASYFSQKEVSARLEGDVLVLELSTPVIKQEGFSSLKRKEKDKVAA